MKTQKLKTKQLKPPRYAKRRPASNADLKASLDVHGQLQPIVATPNREVVIGERRRQALRPSEDAEVVILDMDEAEALALRLSDEFSKSEMTATEKSQALSELQRMLEARGETVTTTSLADFVGTSTGVISDYLRIEALPKPVKKMVAEAKVGYTPTIALARSKLPAKEKEVLARKFAKGTAPAGMHAREVVKFAEKAEPKVREAFTRNPSVSYEEARRFQEREEEKRRRKERDAETSWPHLLPFFRQMKSRLRTWASALESVVELAPEIPDGQLKDDLTEYVTRLANACDNFLERMDSTRHISEREALAALKKARNIIDVEVR